MPHRILVVNPGGGSTKVAVFEDENPLIKENLHHSPERLKGFPRVIDQLPLRLESVKDFLARHRLRLEDLDAISVRGGAFKPLKGGVYRVNQRVIEDVLYGRVQTEHASNLGVLIGWELAKGMGIPVFFADPVSVDEMIDEARPSGIPELERKSLSHALNTRYVANLAAKKRGRRYEEMDMIVVHLGTGISISAHRKGRMIDVNNANDGGPFSPQRAGTLPTTGLIELCFSNRYTKNDLLRRTIREGGLFAYLGTDGIEEVEERIKRGDSKAKLIYDAMVYQIAKEIGAMAAALSGKVDMIIITGGMAHSKMLTDAIGEKVSWIAPLLLYPGEREMEALVFHVLRVLREEVNPLEYE